jgi:hypothetical protein
MRENQGKPAGTTRRVRDYLITAAIVIGGLLMLAGSIYGVVLHPGGPEELGAFWPLYLGGVVAILFGWMNGDLQC